MKKWVKKFLIGTFLITLFKADYSFTNQNSVNVNSGTSKVYNISRKNAERQLQRIVKIAKTEDAWVYINEKLFDVGYDESIQGVYIKFNLIDSLINFYKPKIIYFYHIHPNNSETISPPSSEDLLFHSIGKGMFRKINVDLVSKVFEKHGCWEYDVNLERELSFKDTTEIGQLSLNQFKFFLEGYNSLFDEKKPLVEQIIKYNKGIKNLGLEYKFKKD